MKRLKKCPFVAPDLQRKIGLFNSKYSVPFSQHAKSATPLLKTWSRATTIVPPMLGYTLCVHNGRVHFPLFIDTRKIGHKLGEFSPTRKFTTHKKRDKKGGKKSKN
jgi:small subunit ribosomal protein S19